MSSRIANDLGCGSDPLEISAEVTRVVHERTALEAENARLRASNIDLKSRLESTWEHYHNCVGCPWDFNFMNCRKIREKIVKNQAREIILLAKKSLSRQRRRAEGGGTMTPDPAMDKGRQG